MSYNSHNDLLSNFFYLINEVGVYIANDQNMHATEYHDTYEDGTEMIITIKQREEPTNIEYFNFQRDIYSLSKIYPILELKYSPSISHFKESGISIFEDHYHLLLSRYIFTNWKSDIKFEIAKKISKGISFLYLQNQVIASLKEIELRSCIDFTWDLYNDFDKRWFDYTDGNIREDENGEIIDPTSFALISEDIEWIKNLTEDDVKNQKIIIHEKASKQRLINGIYKMIDKDLLSKVKSSENDKIGYKKEIKNFINYIVQKENEKPSYSDPQLNLSFITKPKEFYKIFYYCSLNHNKEDKDFRFIKSKKTEIAKIFDDTLNKSKNDGYSYSSLIRIVEEDNLTKIENGNKSKRPDELLNHRVFNPIRTICKSDILINFKD